MDQAPFLFQQQNFSKTLPCRRSLDFQSRMATIFGDRLSGEAFAAPQVLFLTRTYDAGADAVGLQLTERGIPYLRVDADDLSYTRVCNSLEDSETVEVAAGPSGRRSCNPRVIWFRHFTPTAISLFVDDPAVRSYAQMEWDVAMRSLLGVRSARWMNHPNVVHELDRITQLRLARSVGFDTPKTLVSNDPGRICSFIESCGEGAIAKVIGSHFLELVPGQLRGVFPYVFRKGSEEALATTATAPCMYQEYISHVAEVRITVAGDEYVATEVYQRDPAAVWESPDDVLVREHDLPPLLWEKTQAFMQIANLEYGAFDFLLSEDGDYVFLEVNPSGDWTWLEARHGTLDITGMVCSHITKLLTAGS